MAIVTASSIRARAHAQPVIENTDDAEVFNAEGVTPEAVDLQSINPLEGVASVTYLDGSTARVVDGVPVLEDRTEGEGEDDESNPRGDTPESDEDRQAREDLEKAEAEQAEAARLEKVRADAPSRGASKTDWETYVASLDPKPEGFKEGLSRDELATLVLGPKQ